MEPLLVEVIAYAPTAFYHCTHCEVVWHDLGVGQKVHREQRDAGLPDDLRQEYARLSDWVNALIARYGERVAVRVVDAASLEGFFKSLRYGVRRYPAIVIAGREKVSGGDYARADALLAARLGPPPDASDLPLERADAAAGPAARRGAEGR